METNKIICTYRVNAKRSTKIVNDIDNFSAILIDGVEQPMTEEKELPVVDIDGEPTGETKPDTVPILDHTFTETGEKVVEFVLKENATVLDFGAFSYVHDLIKVEIGAQIEKIGPYAFFQDENLEEVVMPNSVSSIEKYAFSCCNRINEVSLPKYLLEIGVFAFEETKSLKKITLPTSLKVIEGCAFLSGGLEEVEFNEGLEEIKYSAFMDTNIKEASLPSSLKFLGDGAFSGCRSLTAVTFGDSLDKIGPFAFQGCKLLESVTIKGNIKDIGFEAFRNCDSLIDVTIGENVEKIGFCAFEKCADGVNFKFEGETPPTFGKGVFNYDDETMVVDVPDGAEDAYTEAIQETFVPDDDSEKDEKEL